MWLLPSTLCLIALMSESLGDENNGDSQMGFELRPVELEQLAQRKSGDTSAATHDASLDKNVSASDTTNQTEIGDDRQEHFFLESIYEEMKKGNPIAHDNTTEASASIDTAGSVREQLLKTHEAQTKQLGEAMNALFELNQYNEVATNVTEAFGDAIETSLTGMSFSASNLAVPPVDKISTPKACNCCANSKIPVLSETLIKARFGLIFDII